MSGVDEGLVVRQNTNTASFYAVEEAGGSLYRFVVRPNQAVFVPAGSIVFERAVGGTDLGLFVFGLAFTVYIRT